MGGQNPTKRTGDGDAKFKPSVKSVIKHVEPLGAAYELSPEQTAFFKKEIGIDDDDELRTHMLNVQEKAYKLFPYPCIKRFAYLQPCIETLPEYEKIIELGKVYPDGILLDIGCCFAVDARKAVSDGFPLRNVVTSDLIEGFYDMGHALFNTTRETYPIAFVPGDALDPDMLQVIPPFDKPPTAKRPELSTLTSLNPLAGHCVVIYASKFFHLFSEENQFHLAKALGGLLSPQPGSMICGEHIGGFQKGISYEEFGNVGVDIFAHSPESWCAMWDGEIFAKGSVTVAARLVRVQVRDSTSSLRLQWSVVRLGRRNGRM